MTNCRISLLVCFLFFIFPVPGAIYAFEINSQYADSGMGTETLLLIWDQTSPLPNEHFGAIVNRFDLSLSKDIYLVGISYDTESYFTTEEWDIKWWPEKIFFEVKQPAWTFDLGDFTVLFGRGLTLSVVKREQFGENTTIQGGSFELTLPNINSRWVLGTVNQDNVLRYEPSRAKTKEPGWEVRDQIFGASLSAGHPSFVFAGVNYASAYMPVKPEDPNKEFESADNADLLSFMLQAPNIAGHGSFYSEYCWYNRIDRMLGIPPDYSEGRGAYAALNLNFKPITLSLEAKDYYHFDFPYHEPPNLEYDRATFLHMPTVDDVTGEKARLDVIVPGPNTDIYAAYHYESTHREDPIDLKEHYDTKNRVDSIRHLYGGVEQTFNNLAHLFISGGRRLSLEPEGAWSHGEISWAVPVEDVHEIGMDLGVKYFEGAGLEQGTHFDSYRADLNYMWSPYLGVTLGYEFSKEPLSSFTTGSAAANNQTNRPNFYRTEFKIKPEDWIEINLTAGRLKGGLVCSGGVCREVPPFEGVKAETVLRF